MSDPLKRDGTELYLIAFNAKGRKVGVTHAMHITEHKDKSSLEDVIRSSIARWPDAVTFSMELAVVPEEQKFYNVVRVATADDPEYELMLGMSTVNKVIADEWRDKYRVQYPTREFETVKTHLLTTCPIPGEGIEGDDDETSSVH